MVVRSCVVVVIVGVGVAVGVGVGVGVRVGDGVGVGDAVGVGELTTMEAESVTGFPFRTYGPSSCPLVATKPY